MSTSATRTLLSRMFAVLFAIVLPLATVASWGVTTVTNTNRWVATLHPLSVDPTVTNYLAKRGAATVIQDLHVQEKIRHLLPAGAAFLAGTLTQQLEGTLATALARAIRSHTFQSLWDRENRLTHDVAVAILQGRANSSIATARNVVLNISPTIIEAINQFDEHGNHFFDPLKSSLRHDRKFILRLLSARELHSAQNYFRLATTLDWLLPIGTLILAFATVMTARPRRSGLRRLAVSVIVSSSLAYCLLRIAIELATPLAPTPAPVTKAILLAVTSFLAAQLIALIVIGFAGLAVNWIAGESDTARHARSSTRAALTGVLAVLTSRSRQLARTDWQKLSASGHSRAVRTVHLVDLVASCAAVALLVWWVRSISSLLIFAIGALVAAWISRSVQRRLKVVARASVNDSPEIDATTTQ